MDEIKDPFGIKEEPNFLTEMSKNDSSSPDMDSFETLEASINAAGDFGEGVFSENKLLDDPFGMSGLTSTTRPLLTDDFSVSGITAPNPSSNLLDFGEDSSLIDIGGGDRLKNLIPDPVSQPPQQQQRSGDQLLIDDDEDFEEDDDHSSASAKYQPDRPISSAVESKKTDFPPTFDNLHESVAAETLPKIKDPEIDTKPKADSSYESLGYRAYETAAQPKSLTSEVAMESEKIGNGSENKGDCDCPFSPGAWFDPNKLHPVVAKYVYWKDPKKSGIALGGSLVLLLSLKYFSVISVAAYLTLALLSVTVSFRIYKNILQAVQKSNDGHPFKDYLEMDIALSQEKISQTVETLIQHLNCVSMKLRSLILVEDLVDTIKLLILAWCLTYVGAWFNGLTLIILGVVSGFTLPKVYETNKTQIDAYAELVRTKGKEVIDMVNAKMPLGKKKKDQ